MSNTTPNPHLSYRPDIDGLRALAILLVIIFHAFPKFLRGGFIGVDIFFVISGYLITSIILKGQSQNNFSLVDFYSRRIKRIFPSLIVVLAFCLVAGGYILLGNEYEVLGKHIAAGSIYLSNFVLQSESGYFDTDAELKPLLHLWSLSIEEQFYLVFPLLLIVGARFRINPLLIISTCLGVSFLLNILTIERHPTEVFFFPYYRAWELLVGSSIAYLSLHFHSKNNSKKTANALSWLGATLILIAWIFLDSKKILFPSWWALMPTVGAACLIFAGEHAWFNRKILASKLAVFIGIISYPLYLWHWVLLSFIRTTEMDKPSASLKIAILLMSVAFAWLTYQFVEKKIRFQTHRFVSLGLLTCLLSIGALGYYIMQQKGYPNRHAFESNWAEGTLGNDLFVKMGLTAEKNCVAKYTNVDFQKYTNADFEKFSKNEFCLIQNANTPPTVLLVGDSHANHLYSGLLTSKMLTGGNLLNRGSGGCFPFFDNPATPNEKCPALINELLEMAIATPSIETVILAGRAVTEINEKSFISKKTTFDYLSSKSNDLSDPYVIFQNGMRKTLQRLTAANKRIVFILDIPELEFEPIVCMNRPWRLSGQASKSPCAVPRSKVDSRRKKYLEIITPILKEFPNVNVFDPLSVLCDADYCWAIKDKKLLYRDNNHLNEVGAVYIAEHLHI